MKMTSYLVIGAGVLCLGMAQAKTASTDNAPAVEITADHKAKTGKIKYEGGDGTSQEKAILIKGAISSADGVPAEYKYLDKKYKGHTVLSQKLLGQGEKYYDVINIKTARGKELTIYFDITNFFGK